MLFRTENRASRLVKRAGAVWLVVFQVNVRESRGKSDSLLDQTIGMINVIKCAAVI